MNAPQDRPPLDQTAYWNAVAGEKAFSHPLGGALARFLPPGGRVLDVGCGYGRLTAELAERGFRAVGVDRSAAMVARGRSQRPDLDLRDVAPGPLPFADGDFDGALLFAVLTCIPRAEAQDALLDELARVLRPGGVLCTSDVPLQRDALHAERYAAGRSRYGEEGVFDHAEGVTLRHLGPARIAALDARFPRAFLLEREVRTMNGRSVTAFQHVGVRPLAAGPRLGAGSGAP